MIKVEEKCNCDLKITVSHQPTCASILKQPYCCLCGEEDVIHSGIDAFIYGVPSERFCYDCARVIHDEIIEPIRAFYKEEIV